MLHGRIVEILETLYPERLAEQVERLAHHALRGEVWDKACHICPAGGAGRGPVRLRPAVGLEQALEALPHLPEEPREHGAGHRSPPRARRLYALVRSQERCSRSVRRG